jgi:hypothetical protein
MGGVHFGRVFSTTHLVTLLKSTSVTAMTENALTTTLTLAVLVCCCHSLHIEGSFNPKEEFFHFLAKFGFQVSIL